jgi:hypothetical protein
MFIATTADVGDNRGFRQNIGRKTASWALLADGLVRVFDCLRIDVSTSPIQTGTVATSGEGIAEL